jgi:hypothetical protein
LPLGGVVGDHGIYMPTKNLGVKISVATKIPIHPAF